MFINIDRNRSPQKPKYFLAKPNMDVIANLTSYKYDDGGSFKLGNIDELNFTIPYYVEENFKKVYNKDIDLIREKMLIKMVLGANTEWFIIDEIEDAGDDTESVSITAYSLGYELTHKRVTAFEVTAVNATDALMTILEDPHYPSTWSVDKVHYKFNNMFRTFSIDDSNALDAVLQIAEAFDALVEWDTNNRKISFLDKESDGKGSFKGLTLDYGKLLKTLRRTRTTDEMVTRLYVYGNDGLGIHNINPTGQSYLEDFSYYMYPFEMDATGKVLKSSDFMSDELCIALKKFEKLIETHAVQFKAYNETRAVLIGHKTTADTKLFELERQLDAILDRLDTAKAVENSDLISRVSAEKIAKEAEVASQKSAITELERQIFKVETDLTTLIDNLRRDANFTLELIKELNLFVIERDFRDDRYIDEQELYDDAVKKFTSMREPKVVINIDIENFLEVIEEQYYWDKLVLGDLIKIRYPSMNIKYLAKIIQIDYNFESGEISLTIANAEKLNEMDEIKEILYNSKTASTIITNNKNIFEKVGELDGRVWRLLNEEWDANKQKITAGVNNEIEIGKRGIIITSPDNPNDMVVMQSGIIALSEDGGDTWKTAMKPNGIVAERIIGKLIMGTRLIIEDEGGIIRFTGSLQEIFDENGDIKIEIGNYDIGKYGMRIHGGSLEIVNGLPKDQIDPDAVMDWDSAEKNAKDYADKQIITVNSSIASIAESVNDLQSEISEGFRDGIIEEAEAIAIGKYINELKTSKESLDKEYLTIYSDVFLNGVPKSDLSSAKTAYNTAHTNLINSINNAIADKKTTEAEARDVDNKFTAYNTALGNLRDKLQVAILAIQTAKSNKAEENANIYTNGKDTTLRNNLNLTSPLPTSVKLDNTGITAYSTVNSNSFARMDYRGLYIQGGAVDIRTSYSTSAGVIFDGSGISAYNYSGTRTFHVDTNGNLTAYSGTFGGSLNGANGTFSGTLNAVNGTFSGTLSGANGTFSGTLNAVSGTFTKLSSGTLEGATITGGKINGTSITGGSITSNTNITVTNGIQVGNYINIGERRSYETKYLYFSDSGYISGTYGDGTTISIHALAGVELSTPSLIIEGSLSFVPKYSYGATLNLSQVTIEWGNNKPVAVFG